MCVMISMTAAIQQITDICFKAKQGLKLTGEVDLLVTIHLLKIDSSNYAKM